MRARSRAKEWPFDSLGPSSSSLRTCFHRSPNLMQTMPARRLLLDCDWLAVDDGLAELQVVKSTTARAPTTTFDVTSAETQPHPQISGGGSGVGKNLGYHHRVLQLRLPRARGVRRRPVCAAVPSAVRGDGGLVDRLEPDESRQARGGPPRRRRRPHGLHLKRRRQLCDSTGHVATVSEARATNKSGEVAYANRRHVG